MADTTSLVVATAGVLFGGGGFTAAMVQWLKNRGTLQTRHTDELKAFREDLQKDLKNLKAEHRREISELKREITNLNKRSERNTEDLNRMKLQFAVYRERVRLLITYFRDGNSSWKELASTLENDENEVDDLLKVRRQARREIELGLTPSDAPRILVVDDSPDTLLLVRMALEHEGYLVDTAHNGLDGLRLHETLEALGGNYDLIILDYEMPDMNGEEVGRLIRSRDADTKLVFFTGHVKDLVPGLAEIEDAEIWPKGEISAAEISAKVRELVS